MADGTSRMHQHQCLISYWFYNHPQYAIVSPFLRSSGHLSPGSLRLPKHADEDGYNLEGIPLRTQ